MHQRLQIIFFTAFVLSCAGKNEIQRTCECIPIFMCENGTEIVHGTELIDIRFSNGKFKGKQREMKECENILEICCEPANKKSQLKKQGSTQMSTQGCGIRNLDEVDMRIMSANKGTTKFGEFPWMIAILHSTVEKLDVYLCGGSLIHQKVILTAAHCVCGKNASDIKIRAGEWDTQSTTESLPHQDRAVEEILIHEDYNPKTLHNDVALLIISNAVQIAKNVNIICLPEFSYEFYRTSCIATGWGRNKFDGQHEEILKKVQLPIIQRKVCQNTLRRTRLGSKFLLHRSFICSGGERGEDTCKGDGGSPLVCPLKKDPNRFVQVGIVSWGIECGNGIPSVYANILYARSWIDEQLMFHNLDNNVYQHRIYIDENNY